MRIRGAAVWPSLSSSIVASRDAIGLRAGRSQSVYSFCTQATTTAKETEEGSTEEEYWFRKASLFNLPLVPRSLSSRCTRLHQIFVKWSIFLSIPRLSLFVNLFTTHLEHRINFIKMEMEHVPHERPQYPIPARLVETKLEVLRVQIQVRLERRQPEQNLLGRIIGKLDSVGAAEDELEEMKKKKKSLSCCCCWLCWGW